MYVAPYKIKITGTMRKNKRVVPAEFIVKVPKKNRPLTKFGHAENLTLLSYAPKKKKIRQNSFSCPVAHANPRND